MTKEQLEELVALGESEQVEFKETTGQREDACETLCAFLNADGGTVVFGVSRKGKLTGQLVSDSTRRDLFEVFAKFEPTPDIATEWIQIDDAHSAIVCHVDGGTRKPYQYDGRAYCRIQSSTTVLPQSDYEAMLYARPTLVKDWSAEVIPDVTVDDLDEQAVEVARKGYAEKHAKTVSRAEVDAWPLQVFLEKARLVREGGITRAAMLLVGKELSAQKLSPCSAQLVWKLVGEECANEIFRPPYLLTTTKLFNRIRNVQVRLVVKGTLRQIEVPKYSDRMVLEALHNCIAHQDYSRGGRIVVTEYVDRVTLENQGSFFLGCPEDYIFGERTPLNYRNPQLVDAMSELNMIDTMGYGIHRMYAEQARRYMPLHDYLITPQSVTMTIYGHFVDEAYSSLLVKRPDFQLKDICWLDRVQKGLPIPADVAAGFRKRGLIDGRKPHLRIAVEIPSDENEALIGHEQLRERYRRIFIDFLHRFPGASRQKINDFMIPQMGGEMSENEKAAKISNLMTGLRRKGVIENRGTDKKSQWFLQ